MQAQVAALRIMRMQAQALADLMANFLHDLRGIKVPSATPARVQILLDMEATNIVQAQQLSRALAIRHLAEMRDGPKGSPKHGMCRSTGMDRKGT